MIAYEESPTLFQFWNEHGNNAVDISEITLLDPD